jgi:hypothetical protein
MSEEMPKKMAEARISLFLGDSEYRLKPSELREALAKAGYHIVTEAEKRVLDAMAEAPDSFIRSMESSCEGPEVWVSWMLKVLRAELARRTP